MDDAATLQREPQRDGARVQSDPPPVVVFGSGGHGKVVADIAQASGLLVVAFADDDAQRSGDWIWEHPVLTWDGVIAARQRWPGAAVALGVGENGARARCHERILAAGFTVLTLAHPSATLARSGRIGEGTVLMAHAVVNPDARVGRGVIVNTGAIVEHDCVVGAYAHLAPNVSLGGAVRIGAGAFLGLGAVVLPGVSVGADVVVGAGAVVHRDVLDGVTVVGVPARSLARPRRG